MTNHPEEPIVGDGPPQARVLLSNKVYDWFKKSSLYVLPAIAAAYFGLAQIWGLPKAEEVVGSVAVLETLLGVVLRISHNQYEKSGAKYDGRIVVHNHEDEGYSDVNFQLDPRLLTQKEALVVKVLHR